MHERHDGRASEPASVYMAGTLYGWPLQVLEQLVS
jgi:hypothetical protein